MRTETKHLFNEQVSPNIKSLVLKKRAGIQLTEREQKKLNCFNESVSMVMPPKYHDRISPTGRIAKTFGNQEPIGDEDEEEIDLDEILREMGYYEDEENEEELTDEEYQELMNDLGLDEEDVREYIREIIREKFHEEMELDDEEGPVGEVPDYEEIVMELETMGDDDIEENITYNIDYKSYNPSKYHNITRTFNNERHFNNWYSWMVKQGLKIIGVHKA